MTGAEASAWEAKRAQLEMRDPIEVPAGGFAVVTVGRTSIDLAVERNHLIVIKSGDTDVARFEGQRGPEGVPKLPSGTYHHWHSTLVVPIPATTFPITVYAVDRVAEHRCAWSVDERGKAKLIPGGG